MLCYYHKRMVIIGADEYSLYSSMFYSLTKAQAVNSLQLQFSANLQIKRLFCYNISKQCFQNCQQSTANQVISEYSHHFWSHLPSSESDSYWEQFFLQLAHKVIAYRMTICLLLVSSRQLVSIHSTACAPQIIIHKYKSQLLQVYKIMKHQVLTHQHQVIHNNILLQRL